MTFPHLKGNGIGEGFSMFPIFPSKPLVRDETTAQGLLGELSKKIKGKIHVRTNILGTLLSRNELWGRLKIAHSLFGS